MASLRRSVRSQAGAPTLDEEIDHLGDLDLEGLRVRWQGVFRKRPPAHLPRHLLVGILAYRIQADRLGDLDAGIIQLLKRTVARDCKADTLQLAADFDQRRAELRPGTVLTREWNGQSHRVMVIDAGFAWNGKTYDSLSRIAFAITGTKWNGPRFFGLRDKASAAKRPR